MDAIQEYAAQVAAGQTTDSSLGLDVIQQYADSVKTAAEASAATDVETNVQTGVVDTATKVDEPISTDTNVELDIKTSDDAIVDSTVTQPVFDEAEFVKSKTEGKYSSFEEWEAAVKQPELKFQNDTSKAVYDLLAQGNIKEVYDILQKKQMAETIQDKPDEVVLKSYIKAQNPDFDENEVNDEYNEKYTIDEFAYDDSKLSREQKKLNQRIKADVDNAKQFFKSQADDIKLPVTQQYQQTATQEDDTAAQEERIKYLTALQGVEQRVNQLPFQWKDDKAGIEINGKFNIQAQELTKYRGDAENIEAYYANRYYQDGKYKTEQLIKDMYIADNFDKILSSVVSQAVNQTRLTMLKQSKNITLDQEPSGVYKPNDANEVAETLTNFFLSKRG